MRHLDVLGISGVPILLATIVLACSAPDRDDSETTVVDTLATQGGDDDDGGDGDVRFDIGTGLFDGGDPDGPGHVCEDDIDIVFVMDVSTSMGPFLAKLADEILVVDAAIAALNLPHAPHYGLVVFVDDTLVVADGEPYTDVLELQADFLTWSQFTASNYQVAGGNYNTTWPENSLDALYQAADTFAWRSAEDTLRMIIHTTDDTFWEGPTVENGVEIQHDFGEAVAALQERQIRAFSFAAEIGGMCECLDVSAGWFGPHQGSPSLAESTDGGVFDIDKVLAGQISLSEGIYGSIEDKHCVPYPPQG